MEAQKDMQEFDVEPSNRVEKLRSKKVQENQPEQIPIVGLGRTTESEILHASKSKKTILANQESYRKGKSRALIKDGDGEVVIEKSRVSMEQMDVSKKNSEINLAIGNKTSSGRSIGK